MNLHVEHQGKMLRSEENEGGESRKVNERGKKKKKKNFNFVNSTWLPLFTLETSLILD